MRERERYLHLGYDGDFKLHTMRTCDVVVERFCKELDYLNKHHMTSEFEGLQRVCEELREQGILYFLTGPAASMHTLFDLRV